MSRQSRNPFRPQARVAGKTGPYTSDSKLDFAELDLNLKTISRFQFPDRSCLGFESGRTRDLLSSLGTNICGRQCGQRRFEPAWEGGPRAPVGCGVAAGGRNTCSHLPFGREAVKVLQVIWGKD